MRDLQMLNIDAELINADWTKTTDDRLDISPRSDSDFMQKQITALQELNDYLAKQMTPGAIDAKARGLVPKSGDWNKPNRWVKPKRSTPSILAHTVGYGGTFIDDTTADSIRHIGLKTSFPKSAQTEQYDMALGRLDAVYSFNFQQWNLDTEEVPAARLESSIFIVMTPAIQKDTEVHDYQVAHQTYVQKKEWLRTKRKYGEDISHIFKPEYATMEDIPPSNLIFGKDLIKILKLQDHSETTTKTKIYEKIQRIINKRMKEGIMKASFPIHVLQNDTIDWAQELGRSPLKELQKFISKQTQGAAVARSRGLVPQSGDWEHPARWIRPTRWVKPDKESFAEIGRDKYVQDMMRWNDKIKENLDVGAEYKKIYEMEKIQAKRLETGEISQEQHDLIQGGLIFIRGSIKGLKQQLHEKIHGENLEFKFSDDQKTIEAFGEVSDYGDVFEIKTVVTMPDFFLKQGVSSGTKLMMNIMNRFLAMSDAPEIQTRPLNDHVAKYYKKFGFEEIKYKTSSGIEYTTKLMSMNRKKAKEAFNKLAKRFNMDLVKSSDLDELIMLENTVGVLAGKTEQKVEKHILQKQRLLKQTTTGALDAKRRGLVPQTGDWNAPHRWIRPKQATESAIGSRDDSNAPWNPDADREQNYYQQGVLELLVKNPGFSFTESGAAASLRLRLENAGDLYRELVGNGDSYYIQEKADKLLRSLHDSEWRASLSDEAQDFSRRYKQAAAAANPKTPRAQFAQKLMIAVADRDLSAIELYAQKFTKNEESPVIKLSDAQTGTPMQANVFHGSDAIFEKPRIGRSETGEGFFMVDDWTIGEEYGNHLYAAEVSLTNPKVIDVEGISWYSVPMSSMLSNAKDDGHDGVVFKNIKDSKYSSAISPHNSVVAFNENNVKLTHRINPQTFEEVELS